ncbi:hypothetical protein AAG570_006107 [Ranatra chinensis]|uniref:SET domain-containing protein n=1 Tax=Ranatra chinensis TaxID=642074 RepID=A0ABD0XX25_9HEMI
MCGARCPGLGVRLGHTPEECALLAKVGRQEVDDLLKRVVRADGGTEEDAGEAYNPIVPLRCLLLKKHHPDRWKQINELESHNEIRKTSYPELWASNQRTVVDVVIKKWRIDEFTEEELHTVCGYLEVNSFSIGGRGGCIELRGLYGGHVSLMCHDCTPNTTHTDDESLLMTVRASLAIDKGQPITITYASTLQGTVQRRRHLRESKFFECRCRRCSDPRELGTMLSALRCANCRVGDLLPLKPLEDSSPWSCGSPNCGATVTSDQVQAIVGRIEADFDRIKEGTIEDLEDFLNRHEGVLHSNHYLMVGAMYPLSQMYGKLEGHMIHQMSEEGLARKVDICRSLLKIFGAIEPGMSRIRGKLSLIYQLLT